MLVSRAFVLGGAIFSASVLAACSSGTKATNSGTTTGAGGESSSSSSHTTGGTGGGAAGTGGTTGTAGFTPLPTDEPQVVNTAPKGPVMTSPKIQVIAYAEDAFLSDVEKAVVELGTTATWAEQTAEYGVGSFTVLPTITIAGTPPASLDDNSGQVTPFETNLAAQLSGATPAWGAADQSTIYMFLLPLGTDINSGGHCCTDFLGYHYEAPVGSSSVSYAVVCHCPASKGDPLTPLQFVTTTVSHELVESATDPFVNSTPAFSNVDDPHTIWGTATGGEVADMCEYNADSNYLPPGATYMIQRSWSNAAATAGKNPCVPAASKDPYFNSIPVLTDSVTVQSYGGPITTKGVKVPVGMTKVIDVQLFSEAATAGPWTVTAYDLNEYLGSTANTKVSLDKSTGSSGDTLKLTITVMTSDPNWKADGFVLQSDLNGQQNLWFGAIGN